MSIYLDCNATTPIEPRVREEMLHYFDVEYGNAGSRTHEYGHRAKTGVQLARTKVAAVVDCEPHEVIFTSGATESNNIAILGLAAHGMATGHRHIISSEIEHKAVLEPIEVLKSRGFEVTLVPPQPCGWIKPERVLESLRSDTLLVSIIHANNETGVLQPIDDIAALLQDHSAYFHVDAAQGFGKEIKSLRSKRIDLVSVSGHKIYGPKGVGALVVRSRGYRRPPISPLMHGGGQERGLRPGTIPVPLVVGLGVASELSLTNHSERAKACGKIKEEALAVLASLDPRFNGDQQRCLPHVLNVSFPTADSEAVMIALRDVADVSNGSACTSESYAPSHVLKAMQLDDERINSALRISWCHMSNEIPWSTITEKIKMLLVPPIENGQSM